MDEARIYVPEGIRFRMMLPLALPVGVSVLSAAVQCNAADEIRTGDHNVVSEVSTCVARRRLTA